MSFQYAPVSGDVVGINENLGNQPSLLNKSPEDEGELLLRPHAPVPPLTSPKVGYSNLKCQNLRRYAVVSALTVCVYAPP
jgi:hypothetical protein